MGKRATGPYFQATSGLAFGSEGQAIIAVQGWDWFGRYVALLCALMEEPGAELDMTRPSSWASLARRLDTEEEVLQGFVAFLGREGIADADRLADGVLALRLSTEGMRTYQAAASAGRKAAAARWNKQAV